MGSTAAAAPNFRNLRKANRWTFTSAVLWDQSAEADVAQWSEHSGPLRDTGKHRRPGSTGKGALDVSVRTDPGEMQAGKKKIRGEAARITQRRGAQGIAVEGMRVVRS